MTRGSKYKIYIITSTKTNKQYVGCTQRHPAIRLREHRRAKSLLGHHMRKIGKHTFKIRVLRKVKTRREMFKLERYYIKKLKTKHPLGYNAI